MKQEKNNLKNALCYIPFVAIFLYFAESNKSDNFAKHVNHGIALSLIYLAISVLIHLLLPYYIAFKIGGLLLFIYIIISAILFYKAFNGEDIELGQLEELENKVKDNLKK